ncbi:MAG: squalene synthase HpnC [Blastocatellia bacterium]|nr:squalene synthase HpnC [Blastocatellia bacterium]
MTADTARLAAAFEHCRKIALGHYENFPVGSLLIPKAQRPHVYSVYAFARGADDFADEGDMPQSERLEKLSDWRRQLVACVAGQAENPVFIALAESIRLHHLPLQLFHDLIDAFTLDVVRSRHETFEALLDYSRCSANPVGRLILLLFGFQDDDMHRRSDSICTALQLTNFWQDILVDLEKDRMYLPQSEMARFGYSEADLRANRYNAAYISMMESLADRTEALFQHGQPLCNLVGGRLGFELRLTWRGGMSILEALRRNRFNVFAERPTVKTGQKMKILLKACLPM